MLKYIFRSVTLLVLLTCLLAAADSPATAPATSPHKINVLIVTGGHPFKHDPFFKIFNDNSDITFTEAAEPKDFKLTAGAFTDRTDLATYDVILLYDFRNNITDPQKKSFLALLDRGTGIIVLHHALLSYQDWPDFYHIAGGLYLLSTKTLDGKTFPESTYKGDTDMDIAVTDKDSPVTAGISDFHLKDEIYRKVPTTSDIHTLLTCEGNPLAWSRTEKNSRIVSIIIGHGQASYDNPNFLKLLNNALHWTAKQ